VSRFDLPSGRLVSTSRILKLSSHFSVYYSANKRTRESWPCSGTRLVRLIDETRFFDETRFEEPEGRKPFAFKLSTRERERPRYSIEVA